MRYAISGTWVPAVLALCALVTLAGCQSNRAAGHAGPLLSREQLIARVNANSQNLLTLWARISLDAEIRDPETGKRKSIYAGEGSLQYRAPGELRLRAVHDVGGLILDAGINAERFWMIAPAPGPDTMWWGYVRPNAQPTADMPIAPQDLLQVLAMRPIEVDDQHSPKFAYDTTKREYTLTWFHPVGRGIPLRKVSYAEASLLPLSAVLYDSKGQVSLEATLSAHAPIDTPEKPAPIVAMHIDLVAPASKSRANLRLRDVAATHGDAPNDNSFKFPTIRPVAHEKQVMMLEQ